MPNFLSEFGVSTRGGARPRSYLAAFAEMRVWTITPVVDIYMYIYTYVYLYLYIRIIITHIYIIYIYWYGKLVNVDDLH